MEKKNRILNNVLSIIVLLGFAAAAIASSSSKQAYDSWNGSAGQQTIQHLQQAGNGGKYVGNFSSESTAKAAAIKAGYKYYQYYPSTGECFGYN